MKLKIMIMALLLVSAVGIGSAMNYLPASTMAGDLNTSTYAVTGDSINRPAGIVIQHTGAYIVAMYQNGTIFSTSENFDTVLDDAINKIPATFGSLTILGGQGGQRYSIYSNHTISNKMRLNIDASTASFYVRSENITAFHFVNVDYSTAIFKDITGPGATKSTNGIVLTECDIFDLKVLLVEAFDKGIAIIDGAGDSSLDNDIGFNLIVTCYDGLYLEGYKIEGLRVRGNFINHCYNNSVTIIGSGFQFNDLEIVALEGAGVSSYGLYMTATGNANTLKVTGFLNGYLVRTLYVPVGRWFFNIPFQSGMGYGVTGESASISSVGKTVYVDGDLTVSGVIYPSPIHSVLHVINSQNCATLIPYNCIVTDNMDGTFRITTTGPNANIASPTISVNGGIARYVYIVGSVVGEPIEVGGRNIYYKTAAHGFSPSYYLSRICFYKNKWETRRFDMHTLSVGGDDWKKNTITGWRYDIAGPTGTVYDISYIALVAEAPGLV